MNRLNLVTTALLVVALGGCSGGHRERQEPAPTIALSASTTAILAGETVTLSWTSHNATSVDISNISGTFGPTGSVSATPGSTTKYTATATGKGGSASDSVTITVNLKPPTIVFSSSSTTIIVGESATLSWTTTDATSVKISGMSEKFGPTGSTSITPGSTTKYTATASGPGGSASSSITVTVKPKPIGNGALTLQFASEISDADRTYITDLFNRLYPAAIQVFGPPPDTAALTIALATPPADWGYDATTHTLWIASPPLADAHPAAWNLCFLHLLSYAMTISEHTGVGSQWIADAYSYAGARIISKMLGDDIEEELDYDVRRLAGKEIIGGTSGKFWRSDNLTTDLSVQAGAELFEILTATQSNAEIGDWPNYSALKALKAAQYDIFNREQRRLTDDDFRAALQAVFTNSIEGLPPADWVFAQPIAYVTGTPGVYLYAYPVPAVNPCKIHVVCFERSDEQLPTAPPGTLVENACTSGVVEIAITDYLGQNRLISVDLSREHRFDFDTTSLALGSYRIRASGTANSKAVTAPDSYFGVFDRSLAGDSGNLATLDSVMFLIGKNTDGTPSPKVLPEPAEGVAGKFLQNMNGAAIWQVDKTKTTQIPAPEYVLGGRRLYLPLPFSPVFVIANP